MEFIPIDVLSQIKDNIIVQYSESPNFLAYLEALLAPFEELEEVFADILNLRMLTNATNAQLETNGELVVINRGVFDISTILFLGLDADDINNPVLHGGLGDLDAPAVGGFLRSINQPIAEKTFISDSDYKKTILSKIKRNNFKGGTENVIAGLNAVIPLEVGDVQIQEDFSTPSDPFVTFTFTKELNSKEKSYLLSSEIIPKGGGVRYEYFDTVGPI